MDQLADKSANSKKSARRARQRASSAKTPWTDEELQKSVDVYVLLLRMQSQGIAEKSEPVAQALLHGPLALRNDAAIRYRMRNISAVARELGLPTLADFSPAESVGSSVRPRIRAMLTDHGNLSRIQSIEALAPDQAKLDALLALASLREQIERLESELSWIGHNNPPDAEQVHGIEREDFRQALADIDAIKNELEHSAPDASIIERGKAGLIRFGSLVAKWVAGRATKFVDAALVAAAPIVVAKATGLFPALTNALEAVGRLGH